MANAREVFDRLQSFAGDLDPRTGRYRADIATETCVLYDPNSLNDDGFPRRVTVSAAYVDQYVTKGFLFEQGEQRGADPGEAPEPLPFADAPRRTAKTTKRGA
jgi:hypothetical protein